MGDLLRLVWEIYMRDFVLGEIGGRLLWEITMGDLYGRNWWEIYMGDWSFVWQITMGDLCGEICVGVSD